MIPNKRTDYLRIAVHIIAALPFLKIVFDLFLGNLTANPIQAIEQRTGRYALIFLLLSLACTPLASILGWKFLIPRRKALGNYGFLYALIHVVTFVGIDYGLNFYSILRDVGTKWYILIGLAAFLLLSSLAITSFSYWMKRLGKNWRRLHRLVYIISPLVVVHFFLSVKGDFFRLSGNIVQPFIFAFVLSLLLIFRIPFLKLTLIRIRQNLVGIFSRQ